MMPVNRATITSRRKIENWLFRPKKAKHIESKVQTMRAKNAELKMKACGVGKLQGNIGEMDREELLRRFDIAIQGRRMPTEVVQGAAITIWCSPTRVSPQR